MKTPAFFDSVPAITLRDPLAETLGAAADGVIEYSYLDVVKLAGHSCPTVAGAWLMTRAALQRLYPGELACRGEILVEIGQPLEEGVAGVIGNVAGMITGAANEGGFKGLGNRFSRQGLLRFGVAMKGRMRLTRLDTHQAVEVDYHPEIVAKPPTLPPLMQSATKPGADEATRRAFAEAWQAWVKTILVDRRDDPALVTVVS